MKLIYLHNRPPYPIRSGMDKFTFNLMSSLNQNFEIHLIFPTENIITKTDLHSMQEVCNSVHPVYIPKSEIRSRFKGLGKLYGLIKSYILLEPYHCYRHYFLSIVNKIDFITGQNEECIIQASSIYMEKYLRKYKHNTKIKTVLGPIDDVVPHNKKIVKKSSIKKKLSQLARKNQEKIFMESCNFVTYISGADADKVQKRLPEYTKKIFHCPVYSDMENEPETEKLIADYRHNPNQFIEPGSIIFMGNFGADRIRTAFHYFHQEIFPKILEAYPEVHLYVVGKGPSDSILELNINKNITVTGEVSDNELVHYILKAAVFVAPSLSGSGIKTKTLHAMSLGKAIVATSKEVEGFHVFDNSSIDVNDTPNEFAYAVISILKNPEKRDAMGMRALKLYENYYSKNALIDKMNALYGSFIN
ncbi:MAG: glycosyltransferase family 4 protein [bacterium]